MDPIPEKRSAGYLEPHLAYCGAQSLDRDQRNFHLLKKRIRIALLIDWYLPGTRAGGPVRSVYSLVQLLKNDFDFTIITSSFDLGAQKPYAGIPVSQLFEKEGVTYYYSAKPAPGRKEIENVLKKANPQVIYLNSFWSVSFSLNVLRLRASGRITVPVILAPRGMLGSGALQLKSLKKKLFILFAKFTWLHRDVLFHATQKDEANDIRNIFPSATVMIAPNVSSALPRQNTSVKQVNRLRLFYLSRISTVKNLHYALQALADVNKDYLVAYDIFGNIEDGDYWQQCLNIIKDLPPHITVQHKGELAFDKIQETLTQYNALLLPTLNENYGHSIVESLMSGCLVIISDQTPWTSVDDIGSFALPLKARPAFTAAIEAFARLEEAEFSKRSAASIDYISSKTNIAHAAEQYRDLFNRPVRD